MNDTKRRLELFSLYDYTGIQRHLERMAAAGWMLEKVGVFGWLYRRTEPKKLHFAVTYFPKASDFDAGLAQGQDIYQDYCAQAGWQPVAKLAQMQIFCNGEENPVPMETDAVMQVRNIHQAMKKNYLIAQFMLLGVVLLAGILSLQQLLSSPIQFLSSNTSLFTAGCWILTALLCLVDLACYFRWYVRAKAAAARDGSYVETHSPRVFQAVVLLLFGILLFLWLGSFTGSPGDLTLALISLLAVAALVLLVNLIKTTLKRKKASTGFNRAVTLTACFVLSLIFTGGTFFTAVQLHRAHLLFYKRPAETYSYRGVTWALYRDEIPLRLEDLLDTDYEDYSTSRTETASYLLSRTVCAQTPRMDALSEPELTYTITEVKVPFLYSLCKKSLLEDRIPWEFFRPLAGVSYGGSQVYQLYYEDGTPAYTYLLCWDDRFVELHFSWTPAETQLAIAGNTLAGQ